jgi:predicted permease
MTNFLIILVALAGGYILRKTGKVQASSAAGINAWLINIAMPAVIFKYVPHIAWTPEVIFPFTAPALVLAGAGLFTFIAAKLMRWDHGRTAAVFLGTGWANTSFVGFPLLLAYYGPASLAIGVLCDQITFVLLSTIGIAVAAASQARASSTGKPVWKTVLARVASFPPLWSFAVALVLPRFVDLSPIEPLFDALAVTLGPVALFSVGMQLSFTQVKLGGKVLAVGLVYRLILAPLLTLGAAWVFGLTGETVRVTVFEMGMAPMVTVAVLAAEYGTEPRLASAMLGLGIPLSLLTSLGWWYLLSFWK